MPREVNYDNLFRMRMSTADKAKLMLVYLEHGSSEFWRKYCVGSAELLVKLRAGEITKAEFGSYVSDLTIKLLTRE